MDFSSKVAFSLLATSRFVVGGAGCLVLGAHQVGWRVFIFVFENGKGELGLYPYF